MAVSRAETIGATALQAIPYNKDRTSIAIYNNDATNTLYFGFNPLTSTTNGFPIVAGTGIAFSEQNGDDPKLAIWLIASGANTNVRITEQYLTKKAPEA